MLACRSLGVAALLAPLALLVQTACFCAPGPSGPPPQETCDPEGMTFERVRSLSITSVDLVSGVQGGQHTELRFAAEGDVLPTCARYRLFQDDAEISSGTIRGAVAGTSFASRPIILFGRLGSPPDRLSIEAFGLRSAVFGAPPDAGPPDAPAEPAAPDAPDAPAAPDAP
jgi:hypothetical protein